jgi:hypothetical protein
LVSSIAQGENILASIFEASGAFHLRTYSSVNISTGEPLTEIGPTGKIIRKQQSVMLVRKDDRLHKTKTSTAVLLLANAKVAEIERWEAAIGTPDERKPDGNMTVSDFYEQVFLPHIRSEKAPSTVESYEGYEIRNPNATPVVFQHGTLTSGGTSLWMGSIAMDKVGDLALGFSESSSTVHPTVAFTGRTPSDPLGTMEGIAIIFAGKGSQLGNRWGDYSGMAIDPSNDCTFWYVNEYIPSNGNFNFHTRIASFKFPTCI